MSSGAAPCFSFTVSKDLVKSICPTEYDELIEEMKNCDVFSFSEIALSISGGFSVEKSVVEKLNILCKSFREKTGFDIETIYYDSEAGDIYDDDVSERFAIYGVYELKPLADNWSNSGELTISLWTNYG